VQSLQEAYNINMDMIWTINGSAGTLVTIQQGSFAPIAEWSPMMVKYVQ
jgi:hypothetical protein